jgi:phosphatidylinositol glycan class W
MSEARGGLSSTRDWLALKAEKEAFVSNLEGTTMREVFFIVMALPICALFGERDRDEETAATVVVSVAAATPRPPSLSHAPPFFPTVNSHTTATDLTRWIQRRGPNRRHGPRGAALLPFLVDFALLALPHVALTMPPDALLSSPAAPAFAALLTLWLARLLPFLLRCVFTRPAEDEEEQEEEQEALAALEALSGGGAATPQPQHRPRARFISAFRGGLMLLTCASILAVDFRAFPRRLAKSERYGQGLMDVGVGAFVFAAGLVVPRRRGGGKAEAPAPSLLARLAKSAQSSAPVAMLGLARLFTTKATQYAEHVGEYGVHWNFFLTVAAVGLMTAALPPSVARAPRPAALAALVLLSSHQALLSLTPLGAWVQAEARGPGWLSLNKEGVSSLPGYWGLLMLGAAVGGFLRDAATRQQASPPSAALRALLARAALGNALLWAVALLLDARVERVSRRACNAAYAAWVAALCASALLVCMVGEAATAAAAVAAERAAVQRQRPRTRMRSSSTKQQQQLNSTTPFSPLLCALNRNMLAVFLAANLLTGAVNLSLDTLAAGAWAARGGVALYLAAVCGLAAVLDVGVDVDTTKWLR